MMRLALPALAAACLLAAPGFMGTPASAADYSKPPEPFTPAFLGDATHIEAGGEIWAGQCTHCHGAKAYPGKAPKLKPRKYRPAFVYARVTDGFRKMPGWKEVFTDLERMQVTAYIMSDKFAP